MSVNLMIGCPVRDRAWILPYWFEHVYYACDRAGCSTPYFVFCCPEQQRDDTIEVINKHAFACTVVFTGEPEPNVDFKTERSWNLDRYRTLTTARNHVLSEVRKEKPDYFLSLDSDILINRHALDQMIERLEFNDYDAVGSKTWLMPYGDWCVNYAYLLPQTGGLDRQNNDACIVVDVLMAIKLMTPTAYNVDYAPHPQGEDIGWSMNARKARLTLAWDGDTSIASKHVMHPAQLNEVDQRCHY